MATDQTILNCKKDQCTLSHAKQYRATLQFDHPEYGKTICIENASDQVAILQIGTDDVQMQQESLRIKPRHKVTFDLFMNISGNQPCVLEVSSAPVHITIVEDSLSRPANLPRLPAVHIVEVSEEKHPWGNGFSSVQKYLHRRILLRFLYPTKHQKRDDVVNYCFERQYGQLIAHYV